MKILITLSLLFAGLADAQPVTYGLTGKGTIDLTGAGRTAPFKLGTSDPATCTVGDVLFRSDLAAGGNIKGCTATNTWTVMSGSSMVYPGAGIANSTGSAWTTSYTTSGSGTVLALTTSPTFVTPALGTPASGVGTNLTGIPEGALSTTDITTNNATTSKHGFLKKLDNDSTHFMDGTGAWAVPSGTGGSGSTAWVPSRGAGTATNSKITIACSTSPYCAAYSGETLSCATTSNITFDISANGSSVAGDVLLFCKTSDGVIYCGENTSAVLTVSGCTASADATIPAGGIPLGKASGSYHFSTASAFDDPSTSAVNIAPRTTVILPGDGINAPIDAQGRITPAVDATVQRTTTPTTLTAGTSVTLTAPRGYFVCTGTCTVTPPVPSAGYEFCVLNGDNVSTVITMAAIGSSARYEATARTSYGTAGTGTFVSGGAVGDKVCLLGLDSTHYLTASSTGIWVAN